MAGKGARPTVAIYSGNDQDAFFNPRVKAIDLALDFNGFAKRGGDAAVGLNVSHFQLSVAAVLEPLFADLIAAHLIAPDLRGHGREVLAGIDVNALAGGVIMQPALAAPPHAPVPLPFKAAGGRVQFGRIQQVQGGQPGAQSGKLAEQFFIRCKRHTREIHAQEFGVLVTILGSNKEQHIRNGRSLRCGLLTVRCRQCRDQRRVQVWLANLRLKLRDNRSLWIRRG